MNTTPTIQSRCFNLRSRFAAPAVATALALAAFALPAASHAQSLVFSDPLTGSTSPNLSIPADYSYTAQGLQRTGSAVYRSLVKTVSGAHLTATRFTAEVAVNVAVGDIAFIGLGQGVSNPSYGPNEPTNSFVFRIHNLGGYRQIDTAVAAGFASSQFVQIGGIGNYPAGSTTVFRIERDGDNVKLSVPSQNLSRTYSLAAYSGAMGLTNANTHFFFGSGNTGTRFSHASVSVPVYASGISPVIAWNPIFPAALISPDSAESTPVPSVGYSDPRWTNPHAASVFAKNSHPWEHQSWVPAAFKFDANWINAWSTLASNGMGGPGQSWTKYATTVVGSGSYVLQFLADNASWIYIDGSLVGFQDYNWSSNGTGRYTIQLNGAGAHELSFVIWDGGGLAGGKFRLETTQSFLANNPGATLPPAPATVTLANLSHTYDGTAKSATVTTAPAGLATSVTYNGSSAAPTAVGSYAVVATVTAPNYLGSATGTLTISKAAATITLADLEHTYDGTVKSATATTTPAGLNVVLNYVGARINAGSYDVLAHVNNPNYTGNATGSLAIAKAQATITLGNLTQPYDGSPKSVSVTTAPVSGLATAVTYNGAAAAPSAIGHHAVVATVTDANYTGSTSGTLNITDTVPPVLTLPASQTIEATGSSGAPATFSASATDNVDGSVPVTLSSASGSVFALGTTTVTVTATDAAGNVATGSFTITVRDTTAPALTVPASRILEATSAAGAIATFTVTATDAVTASPAISTSTASGNTFPIGTTTVTITATDAANNISTGTFTITVRDTTAPVVTAPTNIVAEASSAAGAVVNYPAATATDAVGVTLLATSNASGNTFPIGTTIVTVTALDAANNTGTGTFTITVRDTTAPVVTVPANIVAEATSAAGAAVSYPAATATDAVAVTSLTYNTASGSTFPLGTTTVTVTAKDAAGNTSTGSFTITVRDTTAPTITSLSTNAPTLWPPNHKMVAITLSASANDTVGVASLKIISATSNEPDNGLGDGDTANDIVITGNLTLNLRAERSGGGNGRIYTIVVEARDAAGNASTRTVTILVPKSQAK